MSGPLTETLEAYDKQRYPFNASSDPYDLEKEIMLQIDSDVAEEVEAHYTAINNLITEIEETMPGLPSDHFISLIDKHLRD